MKKLLYFACALLSAGLMLRSVSADEKTLTDPVNLLKFQAEERKAFYDDMAAERVTLDRLYVEKQKELLERQRKSRKDFEPQKHSIEERREFYIKQREEMRHLNMEHKQALQILKQTQKQRRHEFHNIQKAERRARGKVSLPALSQ